MRRLYLGWCRSSLHGILHFCSTSITQVTNETLVSLSCGCQAGGSEASEASISDLVQELREAQEKARAAEEELTGFRQHSHQLQQEIQVT